MQKELLENQEYTDFIMKRILEEKLNAEYIVQTSVEQLIRISSHQQNNPIQQLLFLLLSYSAESPSLHLLHRFF